MIQLGERCQWITQKFEHLWFYQRALVKDFYLTLLRVEPLLELGNLKTRFKDENRNEGAGGCSKNLIDAVVDLVTRMETNANKPNLDEEIFIFDATEILKAQFQVKFCCSVRVLVKPYLGNDCYAHMAQHFREVLILRQNLIEGCNSYVFRLASSTIPQPSRIGRKVHWLR